MAKYQKYAEYKDSGVNELDVIPLHWDLSKVKYLASYLNGYAFKPDHWAEFGVPIIRIQNLSNHNAEINRTEFCPLERYKVKAGDILISWSATLDVYIWNREDAWLNQHIFKVSINKKYIDSQFFYWTAKWFMGELNESSHGSTMQHLTADKFGSFNVPLPKIGEQKQIANFLDHETAKIDSLIAKQEKLIELLKEKRQAVISHAVTKGLNPDVTMKDSGVEWLGQVPEHWATTKLKYVVKQIVDAEHKTAPYFDDGQYLVCRTTNVRDGKLRLEGGKYTNHQTYNEWTQRATPEVGDILFTREAPAGEACVYEGNIPLCLGQRMVLFKLNKEVILPEFLLYSLYSGLADDFIKQLSQGSTVTHFNMADIQNIPLFELPKDEQKQIVRYLRNKLNEFQNLEDKAHKAIQLMQERRTALISSAVTGKINVSNWQHPNEAKTEFGA
ncbi:restriction endonuclease subunit S [Acinetobacter indicus]|uniref:restriction endonuclease subunit S n=1 Tax=Acinetobacter indicus TaxID=756892 RepID=UPI003988DFC9